MEACATLTHALVQYPVTYRKDSHIKDHETVIRDRHGWRDAHAALAPDVILGATGGASAECTELNASAQARHGCGLQGADVRCGLRGCGAKPRR